MTCMKTPLLLPDGVFMRNYDVGLLQVGEVRGVSCMMASDEAAGSVKKTDTYLRPPIRHRRCAFLGVCLSWLPTSSAPVAHPGHMHATVVVCTI